jgi:hypothetical protein
VFKVTDKDDEEAIVKELLPFIKDHAPAAAPKDVLDTLKFLYDQSGGPGVLV